MPSPSLNQIKDELLRFAESHGQINTALYATETALAKLEDSTYPLFVFSLVNARKDKRELVLDFRAQLWDLIHPEQDNEADVISDTLLMACDILGFLDGDDRAYTLTEGATCLPVTSLTNADNAGGQQMSFTLRVPFPFDRCIIPTK